MCNRRCRRRFGIVRQMAGAALKRVSPNLINRYPDNNLQLVFGESRQTRGTPFNFTFFRTTQRVPTPHPVHPGKHMAPQGAAAALWQSQQLPRVSIAPVPPPRVARASARGPAAFAPPRVFLSAAPTDSRPAAPCAAIYACRRAIRKTAAPRLRLPGTSPAPQAPVAGNFFSCRAPAPTLRSHPIPLSAT